MKLILLHGMGGGAADWDAVHAQLPDAEAWELPPVPTFAELTQTLANRLAQISAPYGLVGYSLGGRAAIAAAARLLGRNPPQRLALLGAGLGFPTAEERAARRARDEAWADLARRDPDRFWREWYAQGLFAGFDRLPAATREAWLRSRRALDIESLCRQLVNWSPVQHPFLVDDLRRIVAAGISTLYLSGENDKKYQSLAGELVGEGVRTLTIPGAGHILPLEAPTAVASALAEFFS